MLRRTPLKRGTKPLKGKSSLKRSKKFSGTSALLRASELERRTKLPKVNKERMKKLYAKQFGTKGDDMKGLPCWVTGDDGMGFWPVDNAHVGKTRGAGGGSEMLARLRRDVHQSFDIDTDAVFENKWLTTKEWVREQAIEFDVIYEAKLAERSTLQETGE